MRPHAARSGPPPEDRPVAGQDAPPERPGPLEFGDFRFDPETLELSGDGRSVRLQPQPARLLELLIAHRGAVVSREVVRQHLWPDEVHVEYDQSMNSCVKRIRLALGDSADTPEYIETLPRLGYRFLKPVREVDVADHGDDETILSRRGAGHGWPPRRGAVLGALGVTLGVFATVFVWDALDSGPTDATNLARQVLAVRPFSAVEESAGVEAFGQCVAQELITSLGRHASERLAVVAFDLRPLPDAVGEASELKVDFLLDGRVQRQQDRLRVWARLTQVKDGTVLWTEAYDGAASDILVFGAEVGSQITEAVITRLEQMVPDS